MTAAALRRLIASGEGPTLEFKRSTAELREGLRTACGFLNGKGGTVLFGVGPEGEIIGQEISDKTLRELAQALNAFEPPASLYTERVAIGKSREVLALRAEGALSTIPYTFEGRAYERVQSTTRQMSQERYEHLLVERAHSRRRWENQPAEGTTLRDIDREKVFRVLDAARSVGRLVGPVGRDLGRALDRLGVR